MNHPFNSTPLSYKKTSNHSPDKNLNPIASSSISKSPNRKANLSPRKCNPNSYTIHNQQKLKVFIKFKPPCVSPQFLNIAYLNEKEIQIQRQSSNNKIIYNYDRVFHESVSSGKVFSESCVQVIDQMIAEGQNGLIFVYGHTGTGKTYTMGLLDSVDENSTGIVPESLRYIFKAKLKLEQKYSKGNGNSKMQLSLSFNQIYMDEVYDMLDFQSDNKLTIRQNYQTKEPYIENNISITINTIEEAYQLLNIGLEKRRVGQQKCNKRSSRGHGLITITIHLPGCKPRRLCFVDLAGSQRIKQSESAGITLKQAVHINTSLSALQALLMNIDEQSVRMYRGNKLTRLLQPFMQSGKIRLFVTSNYENIQPIQFAKRCKGIKFMQKQVIQQTYIRPSHSPSPKKQQQLSKAAVKQMQKLRQENKSLMQALTSSMVVLNKINRLVLNLMEQQNIRSTFSLSSNYNLSIFNLNQHIEQKINSKINQLQSQQADILEKCASITQLNKDKDKDDSINTSVSNNNVKQDKIGSEMQALISYASKQIDKFSAKLNQLGFGIFHTVKQLASLCQYRNVYKRQMFTYAIKEQLLQRKNNQLESAVNTLLKHCKSLDHNSGYNKIIKQLKQMGIQLNQVKNTAKNKQSSTSALSQPYSTSNSNLKITTKIDLSKSQLLMHHSPFTQSIPVPANLPTLDKNKLNRNLPENPHTQDDDEEQLFGQTYENNVHSSNKIINNQCLNQNLRKSSKKMPGNVRKSVPNYSTNTNKNLFKPSPNVNEQTLHRNAKRTGGLILIQDL